MSYTAYLDTGRNYGVEIPGFAVDWRPGINPSDWIFTDTYAWPVPHGPQPISLMPAVLKPEWETTQADTGPYSRTRLDHFIYPANKVQEYYRMHPKDWVLRTLYDPNGVQITTKWNVNQGEGISFNFAATGKPLSNGLICTVQFGHTDDSKKYNLNIFENGHAFLGRGAGIDPSDQLADGYIVPRHDGSILGRWIKLFIYFYGRNRILIASSTGNSFIWEDRTVSRAPETALNTGSYRISEQSLSGGQVQAYSVYHKDTGFSLQPNTQLQQIPRPDVRLEFPLSRTAPVTITANTTMHIQMRSLAYGGTQNGNWAYGTITGKTPTYTNAISSQSSGNAPLDSELPTLKHFPSYDNPPGAFTAVPSNPVILHITDAPDNPFGIQLKQLVMPDKRISLTPTVRLSRPATNHGDENKSPTFYRHETNYYPTPAEKPTAPDTSFQTDIVRFTHNHDKDGVTGSIEIRNLQNHVPYKRAFNIPFQWAEDNNVYVQGYLSDPAYHKRKLDQRLTLKLTDEMKLMKTQYLGDMKRLDGLAVDEAVQEILLSLGFPSDGSMWVIDPVDVITDRHGKALKKVSTISKGQADDEPTNLSDVLRTAEDWLRYLIETYTSCANYPYQWVMGWAPYADLETGLFTYKFFFRNPDVLNALPPTKHWYETREQAIRLGGADYDLAYRDIYTDWESEAIEPEFNALLVCGVGQVYDPDTGESEQTKTTDMPDGSLIKVYKEDKKSIDPTIPLAQRQTNWLGWRQLCVIYDGALNTSELTTAACGKIFARGSIARERATLKAEWKPEIRIWDQINVHIVKDNVYMPQSDDDYQDVLWTVTGFDVEHQLDTADSNAPYRQRMATYYLERGLPN